MHGGMWMIRQKKAVVTWFVVWLFVFSNLLVYSPVQANSSVSWKDLGNKVTADVNKAWTIKMSDAVDHSTVNNGTVYVKDDKGNAVDVTVQVDGQLIKIIPVSPYKIGYTYTLYLDGKIQTKAGKKLKSPVKFSFTIQDPSSGLILEEPSIFPSNTVPVGYSEDGFRLAVFVPVNQSDLAVYDEEKGQSSVVLSYLSPSNNWETIGNLYDSGDLNNHSDEIAGDSVYSINLKKVINTDSPKQMKLRVSVKLKNGNTLYAEKELYIVQTSNGQNVEKVLDMYDNLIWAIEDMAPSYKTSDEVMYAVKSYLLDQDEVKSVEQTGNGFLEITYDTGLKSGIQIVEQDAKGSNSTFSTTSLEQESKRDDVEQTRNSTLTIPLEEQTRGEEIYSNAVDSTAYTFNALNINEIVSRTVFLWAPFYEEFFPWNEEEDIQHLFEQSGLGFNVVKLKGEKADVQSLKQMNQYGFVLLSSHGSGGQWILTGETVKDSAKYESELISQQMMIVQRILFDEENSQVQTPQSVYAVNDKWFKNNINGMFNNTVIFNSSCESTLTDKIWNVFASKGAGAYYGFSKIVSSRFAYEKAIETTKNLLSGKTTGQSFVSEVDPYTPYKAKIELKGNGNLFYNTKTNQNSNLVNGNFEQALFGWTQFGDARVISGLGSPKVVSPTEGKAMAIISTGLGYTTYMGEIAQTFYLSPSAKTISFNWNYLSEEFLEYIGSGFEDPFSVTLRTIDGTEETVLHLTLNDLALVFGANQYDGGSLIPLSPAINFDKGDVWMTGWQTHEYVIPEKFKGKVVTLTFTAQDAKDTIYDTAVLIDSVVIQ